MKPGHEKDLDARIDASLQRSFAPPDLSALQERIEAAARARAARPADRRPGFAHWLAAAAALAAVAGGTWWIGAPGGSVKKEISVRKDLQPEGDKRTQPEGDKRIRKDWTTAYFRAAKQEFPAGAACTDLNDLTGLGLPPGVGFRENSAVALLGEAPAGKQGAPGALQLQLQDGLRIWVFVRRPGEERPWVRGEYQGLNLFERQLGETVLYELTPLDHAMALEHFHLP